MNTKIEDEMNILLLKNFNKKTINFNNLSKKISEIKSKIDEYDFNNNKHKYLTLSCIFGSFLGDSMGSCCQFSLPSPKNHLDIFKFEEGIFAPGEVTDDSEMAMAAAFAYMDCPNQKYEKVQDLLYYYFCIWKFSCPKDIGRTISNALELWDTKLKVNETIFNENIKNNNKKINYYSLANGFLMRISTFIVFYYYTNYENIKKTIQAFFESKIENEISDELFHLYIDILIECYKNVEITHPNPENGIVSSIFTIMVLTGMFGYNQKDILFIFKCLIQSKKLYTYDQLNIFKNKALSTQTKLIELIEDIEKGKQFSVIDSMGYYLHAFKLTIYFLNKYKNVNMNEDSNIYYNIMCDICDFGGDTDTNCAIVGTLIGPLIGYKNFDKKLFDRFISFIPEERTEFISSFMFIYVNYLEKKYFDKIEEEKKEYDFTTIKNLYDFFYKDN